MISLKNTELCNTSQRYGPETGRREQNVAQPLWSGDYVVHRLVAKPPHHIWLAVLWLLVCYVVMVSLDNGGRHKIFKLSLTFSTFKSLEGEEKLFCSAIITVICLSMLFSSSKGYIPAETEKGTSGYLLYFVQFMLKYEMKTLLLDVHVTIQ
jgi:hypothetical protein